MTNSIIQSFHVPENDIACGKDEIGNMMKTSRRREIYLDFDLLEFDFNEINGISEIFELCEGRVLNLAWMTVCHVTNRL